MDADVGALQGCALTPGNGLSIRVESLYQSLTKLDNKKILAILKIILSI
jgi:hypothetical protein